MAKGVWEREPLGWRFYTKVAVAPGCWRWLGACAAGGYGVISYEHENILAHRLSYMLFNGRDPGELYVCHRCDNSRCVNPEHLFLASNKENMQDAVRKDRVAYGPRHGMTHLDDQSIHDMRKRFRPGKGGNYKELCAQYEIDHTTLYRILKRDTWRRCA